MTQQEEVPSTAVVVNAVYSKEEEYKVLRADVLCSAVTVMVLAIFSLNVFAFLFGIIVLVTIHQQDLEARNWYRVIKPLYVIVLVILIIILILAILLVILAAYRTNTMYIVVGIVLFILTIFEITYTSRAKMSIMSMLELGINPDEPRHQYLDNKEVPA